MEVYRCLDKPPYKPSLPAAGPLPFIFITGAVYPGEPSWTDPKGRAAALNAWVNRIAKEAGRRFGTHGDRSAAEAFAKSHRLSIANAFERKLVRKDVVEALLRLYEKTKDDDPTPVINSGGLLDHSSNPEFCLIKRPPLCETHSLYGILPGSLG